MIQISLEVLETALGSLQLARPALELALERAALETPSSALELSYLRAECGIRKETAEALVAILSDGRSEASKVHDAEDLLRYFGKAEATVTEMLEPAPE